MKILIPIILKLLFYLLIIYCLDFLPFPAPWAPHYIIVYPLPFPASRCWDTPIELYLKAITYFHSMIRHQDAGSTLDPTIVCLSAECVGVLIGVCVHGHSPDPIFSAPSAAWPCRYDTDARSSIVLAPLTARIARRNSDAESGKLKDLAWWFSYVDNLSYHM
jgi:hypothetical protein